MADPKRIDPNIVKRLADAGQALIDSREALYAAIVEAVRDGVPKLLVSQLTGISRPTIDKLLRDK